MEQNIYIMEFWKLKKNRKRIVFCVIFCSIITFLIFTLACKIIGADVMEACVPVHIMRIIVNNFYPEIIIDGEISYSILMYDSFIFYGTIIFLITFLSIYKFMLIFIKNNFIFSCSSRKRVIPLPCSFLEAWGKAF